MGQRQALAQPPCLPAEAALPCHQGLSCRWRCLLVVTRIMQAALLQWGKAGHPCHSSFPLPLVGLAARCLVEGSCTPSRASQEAPHWHCSRCTACGHNLLFGLACGAHYRAVAGLVLKASPLASPTLICTLEQAQWQEGQVGQEGGKPCQ